MIKICLLITGIFFVSCCEETHKGLPYPKNIIIFIGDGMGYNHVLAANYYEYGVAKAQVYEQDDWIKLGMATYNSFKITKEGDTVFSGGYNPGKAWNEPKYIKKFYTDSGASATAISTGKKTYDGSIGMGVFNDTLLHLSQMAKRMEKAVGIVSSLPFSHATPAGFIAHNESRNNYIEIAQQIIFNSYADVVMGPGNPDFDNDGKLAEMDSKYVGGRELWEQLKSDVIKTEFNINGKLYNVKDINNDGKRNPWSLIQRREEFNELIDNPVNKRILGIPMVYNSLQSERSLTDDEVLPYSTPFINNVPNLQEMTQAALGVLSLNPNGFFIMIEGGAIDWASHDNLSNRMIEEQIDFNNSVRAAVEWVEKNSNWDETLIIVTSDHECGYLTGPSHPEIINSPVKNKGRGNLPDMKWNYDHHTNQLVPFYAKGAGAELFEILADEYDLKRGAFIQNTDIAKLIFLLWHEKRVKNK